MIEKLLGAFAPLLKLALWFFLIFGVIPWAVGIADFYRGLLDLKWRMITGQTWAYILHGVLLVAHLFVRLVQSGVFAKAMEAADVAYHGENKRLVRLRNLHNHPDPAYDAYMEQEVMEMDEKTALGYMQDHPPRTIATCKRLAAEFRKIDYNNVVLWLLSHKHSLEADIKKQAKKHQSGKPGSDVEPPDPNQPSPTINVFG